VPFLGKCKVDDTSYNCVSNSAINLVSINLDVSVSKILHTAATLNSEHWALLVGTPLVETKPRT